MPNGNQETLGERIARLEQRAINQSEALRRIEKALENHVGDSRKLTSIESLVRQSQTLFEALDEEVSHLKEENRRRVTEIRSNTEFIKTRFWLVTTVGLTFLALMDFAFRLFL